MNRKVTVFWLALVLTACAAVALLAQAPAPKPAPAQPGPQPAAVQPAPPVAPETFRGTLANQGGPGSKVFQAGWFNLTIEHYTTDEEAKALAEILKTSGQQALLDKVWKMKQIGYLKVGGSMGYPIFVARSLPSPDGRVIRCATNRPVAPRELNYGTRSMDYPFGVIEIYLPTEGKGTGVVVGMAKVSVSASNTLQIEGYGTLPLQLLDVTVEQKKK